MDIVDNFCLNAEITEKDGNNTIDLNEKQVDDGMDWIYFEESVTEVVTPENEPKSESIATEVTNKRKVETNENNFRVKTEKRKSIFNRSEEMAVIWNFNEFEGIPSQRPYPRI